MWTINLGWGYSHCLCRMLQFLTSLDFVFLSLICFESCLFKFIAIGARVEPQLGVWLVCLKAQTQSLYIGMLVHAHNTSTQEVSTQGRSALRRISSLGPV